MDVPEWQREASALRRVKSALLECPPDVELEKIDSGAVDELREKANQLEKEAIQSVVEEEVKYGDYIEENKEDVQELVETDSLEVASTVINDFQKYVKRKHEIPREEFNRAVDKDWLVSLFEEKV